MRRYIFPVLLGLAGCAVLITLGVWQVQRLDWKRGILNEIEARIAAEPVALKEAPNELDDEYRAVALSGTAGERELHVLVSGTAAGTGYRVITAFETDAGRRILMDHGLLPLEAKDQVSPRAPVQVTANLIWPDDVNSSTPAPDLEKNIWFARDIGPMAEALDTERLMVVLRSTSQPDLRLMPLPVDTRGIKNDHREYAITWFLLAAVWAAMTLYLLTRIARQKD